MRNYGISMHAIANVTDEKYVRLMAEHGFRATFSGHFATDREQAALAELLAKHGVTYENLHAPFGHINDIWLDSDEGQQMFRELCDCVDRAVAAGVPTIVVHLSSGMNPPSVTDLGRARFTCLVDYAARRGVKVAFENQRWMANLAWAMEYFSPDVAGFCWDCGHEACFTPGVQYMPIFGNRLICTHIHDNSCEFNSDDHMIPFDGKIDFDRVARQIRESGFEGSLMLELSGNGALYEDITPDAYFRRAADAARRLVVMTDGGAL